MIIETAKQNITVHS